MDTHMFREALESAVEETMIRARLQRREKKQREKQPKYQT
jgi:hypothetical protein